MRQSIERMAYTTYCTEFQLKPEWLDKTFKDSKGKTYTITGLNLRSKKFPVETKEGVRFNADYLRGLMTGDPELFARTQQEKQDKKLQQARKDFALNCAWLGLEPSWLDKTFVDRGTTYTIYAVLPNARRYNVVVRKQNNDVVRFQAPHVIKLMNEQYPSKKEKKAA